MYAFSEASGGRVIGSIGFFSIDFIGFLRRKNRSASPNACVTAADGRAPVEAREHFLHFFAICSIIDGDGRPAVPVFAFYFVRRHAENSS